MSSKGKILELKDGNKELRVQLASDIHLEMFSSLKAVQRRIPGHELYKASDSVEDLIKPSAPVLALLGDIGCPATSFAVYESFLREMSLRFEHVLVLAGNHEYYVSHWKTGRPKTMPEIQAQISDLCATFPNVHFLDRSGVMINGVRVLGTTLWSHVPDGSVETVQKLLNDYHMINVPGESWIQTPGKITRTKVPLRKCKVSDTNQWHADEVKWLKSELEALPPGHQALVLTHHAPTFKRTSNPVHDGSPIGSAFATDLEWLLQTGKIHTWAFGHTHFNTDYMNNGVRIVANQFGYVQMEQAFGYVPSCVVSVPLPKEGLSSSLPALSSTPNICLSSTLDVLSSA